jgi:hypothetical protein
MKVLRGCCGIGGGFARNDASKSRAGQRQNAAITGVRNGHRRHQADAKSGSDQRKNIGELIAQKSNGIKPWLAYRR